MVVVSGLCWCPGVVTPMFRWCLGGGGAYVQVVPGWWWRLCSGGAWVVVTGER